MHPTAQITDHSGRYRPPTGVLEPAISWFSQAHQGSRDAEPPSRASPAAQRETLEQLVTRRARALVGPEDHDVLHR